ncbi:MAG TPA: hypothetical protein VF169_25015 [Albitalea sp.]|uniref:hypothetical protein n=1 Tax=Piscinibacter sp. TaxID=1903157 RepID=UPI002ED40B77
MSEHIGYTFRYRERASLSGAGILGEARKYATEQSDDAFRKLDTPKQSSGTSGTGHALSAKVQQAVNQALEQGASGTAASLLDSILALDGSVSTGQGMTIGELNLGLAGGSWDEQAQRVLNFLQHTSGRPPQFQSVALRAAAERVVASTPTVARAQAVLGEQAVRTALFDAVMNQANQLPSQYRNEVRQHLLSKLDRLPEQDREGRRQALQQ